MPQHWCGAPALTWCLSTDVVLHHWRDASALTWCLRTDVVSQHSFTAHYEIVWQCFSRMHDLQNHENNFFTNHELSVRQRVVKLSAQLYPSCVLIHKIIIALWWHCPNQCRKLVSLHKRFWPKLLVITNVINKISYFNSSVCIGCNILANISKHQDRYFIHSYFIQFSYMKQWK